MGRLGSWRVGQDSLAGGPGPERLHRRPEAQRQLRPVRGDQAHLGYSLRSGFRELAVTASPGPWELLFIAGRKPELNKSVSRNI